MPRTCKVCKTKFTPQFNSAQLVCSPQCGYEYAKKQREKNSKKLKETKEQDRRSRRVEDLQKEINKLARLIDFKFNLKCIDTAKPIKGSGNGAHYKNVGGHQNIRFNLHNIHLSTVYANKYNPEHKKGYKEGLIKRYGEEYQEYLETTLNLTYKEMHFSTDQIDQALKTTRKLIRDFDTFELTNPIIARDMFNSIIGIYDKPYLK